MAPKRSSASTQAASASAPTSAAKRAKQNGQVELDVGGVRYSCLCTQDPKAADAWAAEVLKSAGSPGSTSDAVVVGMDCEWAAPWHRGPDVPDRLATLQLFHHGPKGMRALVLAVAGLDGKLPPALVSLLGDVRVVKLGANLTGDATRVVRDFGCEVRGIFDLSRLNKKPGAKLKKGISLEVLVKTHCPEAMHLSKAGEAVRTSNWEQWPLTEEQVVYASRDAALSLMAFMSKFGMSTAGPPALTKDASDALVDLDAVDVTSVKQTAESQAESSTIMKKPAGSGVNKAHFFQHMRSLNVKAPNLGKKDHPVGSKDALAGVCIVVSGTLDSFERSDMEAYVQQHGGKVSKSVTAKVTHLVTDHGEAGPSKLSKCKELGIPVVSEDVILEMVGKGASAGSTAVAVSEPAKDQAGPKASKKRSQPVESVVADTAASSSSAKKPRGQTKQLAADADSAANKGDEAEPTTKKKARVTKAAAAESGAMAAPNDPSVAKSDARNAAKEVVAEPAKSSKRSAKVATAKNSSEQSAAQATKVSTPVASSSNKANTKSIVVAEAAADRATKAAAVAEVAADIATPARRGRKKSSAGMAQGSGVPKATAEVVADAATPGAKKSKKEAGPTPPKKGQTSAPVAVELDSATLEKAEALSMRSALTNLAGRMELQNKGLSAASLLSALQKTEGLVNPAKRMLLGI